MNKKKEFYFYRIERLSSDGEVDLTPVMMKIPEPGEKDILYIGLKRNTRFKLYKGKTNIAFITDYIIITTYPISLEQVIPLRNLRPIYPKFQEEKHVVEQITLGISGLFPGRKQFCFENHYLPIRTLGYMSLWIDGVNEYIRENSSEILDKLKR